MSSDKERGIYSNSQLTTTTDPENCNALHNVQYTKNHHPHENPAKKNHNQDTSDIEGDNASIIL